MVLGGGLRRGAKIAFGFFTLLIIVGMTSRHLGSCSRDKQQKRTENHL